MKLCLLLLVLSLCSACGLYRMPAPDEYSLVPVVNNPLITHDPGDHLVPNIN